MPDYRSLPAPFSVLRKFGLLLFIGQGEENLTVFVKNVSRGFSNGVGGHAGIFQHRAVQVDDDCRSNPAIAIFRDNLF